MRIKTETTQFKKWIADQQFYLKDFFPTINSNEIYPLDLSVHNKIVKSESEFNNPAYFRKQLDAIQKLNPNKIITGGYLEKRALYTSDIYNSESSLEKRNIHLGVDFWLPEKTPVHSLFDGKVICAHYQTDYKGYGGFIILQHTVDDFQFYTLYGHLSKDSISKFSKGDDIKVGSKIGELGNYKENGAWVPHLHFQIMLSLLDYKNDFPGVVLESEINFWKDICPDPNVLFKLKGLILEKRFSSLP